MKSLDLVNDIDVYIHGCDDLIVNSARVSFDKTSKEYFKEKNIKLIKYLYQHKHFTPFEHVFIFISSHNKEYLKEVFLSWKNISKNYHLIYYSKGKERDFIVISLRIFIDLYNDILQNNNFEDLVKLILYKINHYLPATAKIIGIDKYLQDKFNIQVNTDSIFNIVYSMCESNIKTIEIDNLGKVSLINKTNFGIDMDIYSFIIECPIFIARQWMRHRFGIYNEVSRRYVDYEPDIYIPEYIRIRDKNIKQGSIDKVNKYDKLVKFLMKIHSKFSKFLYNLFVNKLQVPPEQARIILPLSMKTKFYWSVPKISLDNFINLRIDNHAQKEIRIFAEVIKNIIDE